MENLTAVQECVKTSTTKVNCWEFRKCGREPGGDRVAELGVCPASTLQALDGAHGGKNAGRACWAVAGSFCGGAIQGTYAQKLRNCRACDFMIAVKKEESFEPMGFSATRWGIERVLLKQKAVAASPHDPARERETPLAVNE